MNHYNENDPKAAKEHNWFWLFYGALLGAGVLLLVYVFSHPVIHPSITFARDNINGSCWYKQKGMAWTQYPCGQMEVP